MSSTEAAPRHGSAHQSHPWGFAVFFLTPTIYNFIYAFTDWSSFKTTINPVGWSNFSDLIASGSLRKSLIITLIYAAGVAALQNLFGLMLAVLLERDTLVNKI
ncbi:sugar ABC transporter permease, partial [Cutibacterium acnes]